MMNESEEANLVSFADFKKLELRLAKILEVEEIPGADKLWKLHIEVGDEKKIILAGIKLWYTQEELVGKVIVVVNNLAPATIRGIESNGMLLATKDGETLALLGPDKPMPSGAVVS